MRSIYSMESRKFAARLRAARIKAGLSQKDAAESLCCSQSYISKVESGQSRLDIVQLKEFARLYKVALTTLAR